ncbi:MAG TPA: hypothetical protein VK148_27410 [Xanthobacteraceae bacterium]|nr:hypothetical protein [Xanthobacteraceae bacterium]
MLGWLLRRWWHGHAPDPGAATYRAYTTKFDRVISGEEIPHFIGDRRKVTFEEYATELDGSIGKWRAAAEIAAVEAVGSVDESVASDTVASLLVDHSGSLRGQRAIIARAIIEIVAEYWSRIGIRFEILGFTTQSWHGGKARRRWKWAGKPRNPGRLCDLLHIVYRSADDSAPGAPWTVRYINHPELLKENIDGEAIEWAASRLLALPETNRLLVVLSDGAPVDDSTLLANDPEYLNRHLRSVLAATQAQGIDIAAVGVGDFVEDFYAKQVMIRNPQDMASLLIPFIAGLSRLRVRAE